MYVVCSDLEGIFVPEVWISVAEKTGIEELKLTTRDISDYDVLMKKRLSLLEEYGLKLKDITDVIATMEPLDGALEFLDWLRSQIQLIIVSDTYVEFAKPLMEKLRWPTLFCHSLSVDNKGNITGYNLRQKDSKQKTVLAMQSLHYKVIAIGDSYNDIKMLKEANTGLLFRPPDNVRDEFSQFTVSWGYDELKKRILKMLKRDT
jgi:phosphoserine/homoserine phosphotransferase